MSKISRLRRDLKAAKTDFEEAKDCATVDVLVSIAEWDFVESLPNFSFSLELFLTICVSVASCERSFWKLELIKDYISLLVIYNGTVKACRFCAFIESDLTKGLDVAEVIHISSQL